MTAAPAPESSSRAPLLVYCGGIGAALGGAVGSVLSLVVIGVILGAVLGLTIGVVLLSSSRDRGE